MNVSVPAHNAHGPISEKEWLELRRATVSSLPDVVEKVGLPAVLLPYQGRAVALMDSAATSVLFVEKSRRVGLTWGLAAGAVLRAARQKSAGGMDAMYISYSQEMTREFIDACAMWARAFSLAAFEAEETLFDDSDENGERQIGAFRIRFASGFEILALSSAPRSLRGKQGVVIIDEAAFVDSLKELLKAALAFLMWGGKVVVVSTHNGVDNEFNVQIQEILGGRSKYDHMHVDFDEALKEGLYQRICLVTGKEWSPESEATWRQGIIDFYSDGADEELFCIPSQSSGAWLSGPLIEARMTSTAPILRLDLPPDFLQRPELEQASLLWQFRRQLEEELAKLDRALLYALGFDFARVSDLSILWLLAISQTMRRETALVIEMRRVPYEEQRIIVDMVMSVLKRLVGAAFDATGSGEYIAEAMMRKYGSADGEGATGLVSSIKLSAEWYRTEMPPLKTAFEDNAIAIPKDAETLVDFRLIQTIRGVAMPPPIRTGEQGKKRHADSAVACALAHYASRLMIVHFDYQGLPAVNSEEQDGDDEIFGRDVRVTHGVGSMRGAFG